jgi:hypothetical protein
MLDEFANEGTICSEENPSQSRVKSADVMGSENERAVSSHDSRDGARDVVDTVQMKNLRVRLPHRLEQT